MNAWWLVSLLAPAALLWIRPRWSVIHIPIALLIGWALYTAQWTPHTADAIDALWKISLGLMLFCAGFEARSLDRFYVAAGVALIPSSFAAIWQVVQGLPGTGLFGNPNMMGEVAALVVVALAGQQSWIMAAAVLPALILAQSRGAVLAALLLLVGHRSIVVVILACAAALFLLPGHRDFLSSNSLVERATIWSDTLSQIAFFGHGIGGFAESLNSTLGNRLVEHAHNDFLEMAFELGVPGLVLGAMILFMIMFGARHNEFSVLMAFGVEAMFGFPLHAPATAVIGAVVAGHAARPWGDIRWRLVFGRPVFLHGNAVERIRG